MSFAKDSPTETLSPTLMNVTSDSFDCVFNIKDADGMTNKKCVFMAGSNTYQPSSSSGDVFHFSQLPSDTSGYIVSSALANVKLANGTMKTQYVETRTLAKTNAIVVVDTTPPVITLNGP